MTKKDEAYGMTLLSQNRNWQRNFLVIALVIFFVFASDIVLFSLAGSSLQFLFFEILKLIIIALLLWAMVSQYQSDRQQAFERYHSLIDSIDGIVWESDASLQFTFVSKQAERLLGYPLELWTKDPLFWVNHLHPDDKESTVAFCKDKSRLLLPHDFEYRIIAMDGSVKWLRDIVSVISRDHQLLGLRGIMIDITEMKKSQDQLENSLSILEATLEAAADGIIVMDLNGKIIRTNQRFLELWNIPQEMIKSTDVMGIVDYISNQLVDPISFEGKVKECFTHRDVAVLDLVNFKDGKTFERLSQPQIVKGKIVGRVSSFRDVTASKQMEWQRESLLVQEREARNQAEKSIQLRDDFLSIASHELKTPLTPIWMQLKLLKRKLKEIIETTPKAETMNKILEDADKQFGRFLKLVEDLLDVSRITADRMTLQRENMNFSEMVEEKVHFLEEDFKNAGCDVKLSIEPEIYGYWDRLRLEQVLTNLLSNARKYGAGYPISIDLTKEDSQKENARARLIIRDYGIGISKSDQEKLFGRFERMAPLKHYGGLGLGLYITHNIISAHGGTVRVESELGKGSSFIVELPLTQAAS